MLKLLIFSFFALGLVSCVQEPSSTAQKKLSDSLSTKSGSTVTGAPADCILNPTDLFSVGSSESKTLNASCSSGSNFTYQWEMDGISQISTASSFSFRNLSAGEHLINVVVANSLGSVTLSRIITASEVIGATVVAPSGCSIGLSPIPQTMTSAESKTLSVSCASGSSLTYAWTKGSTSLGSNSSYTINNPIVGTYVYNVTVSNSAGSVQLSQSITVYSPTAVVAPSNCSITKNPNSSSMAANESKSLTVSCVSGINFSYQWKKNGVAVGSNSSSYTVSGLNAGSYSYSVTVSNSAGNVTVTEAISVTATLTPPSSCSISKNPNTTSMSTAESKTLSVSCLSGESLNYSWKQDGVNVGGNSSSYIISGVVAGTHAYSVTVSNSSGSLSLTQSITVTAGAPSGCSILKNPSTSTMTTAESKTLSVTCSGGTGFSYEWKKNGVVVGTNSSSLMLSSLSAGTFTYSVKVANSLGSSTIDQAITVTAIAAIPSGCSIAKNPNTTTMTTAETKALSVSCTSGTTLSYVWKKNGVAISGATSSQYTASSSTVGTFTYSVAVSNSLGSASPAPSVAITVSAPSTTAVAPSGCSITKNPSTNTMTTAETKNLSVSCTSGTNLSYVWKKSGVVISGATSSQYAASSSTVGTFTYSVAVSNSSGSVSPEPNVAIIVSAPSATIVAPSGCTITKNPNTNTMITSETKNLSVSCTNGTSPSYVWKKDGVAISGATSSLYAASSSSAGTFTYSVAVSNSSGSASPEPSVAITVTAPLYPTGCILSVGPVYSSSMQVNETKTLTINCTGGVQPLSYQWRVNGSNIATTQSISISWPTPGQYNYDVIISNSAGSTSNTYGVNVFAVPILATGQGSQHTCVIKGGAVYCWGQNNDGQLGIGNLNNMNSPQPVTGLSSGVTQVSLGQSHSCALVNGGVKCWGHNQHGQVGDGTFERKLVPTPVSGLTSGVATIAVGPWTSCALLTSGSVKCWGSGFAGLFKDGGATNNRNLPVPFTGFTGSISKLAIGANAMCILISGAVKCVGHNSYGELGVGSHVSASNDLVSPPTVYSGVTQLNAGWVHFCAVKDGALFCWGYNSFGRIGNNSEATQFTPVQPMGLASGIESVYPGSFHTCAKTSTGAGRCWGYGGTGALGTGNNANWLIPVDIYGFGSSGIDQIYSGAYHTCLVTSSANICCMGGNGSGELGNGTNNNSPYYSCIQNF